MGFLNACPGLTGVRAIYRKHTGSRRIDFETIYWSQIKSGPLVQRGAILIALREVIQDFG